MGVITVRLNEEVVNELDDVAKETGRSRGNVIKRAINFYLQEFADLDIAVSRRRREKSQGLDAETVWKNLEESEKLKRPRTKSRGIVVNGKSGFRKNVQNQVPTKRPKRPKVLGRKSA